MPFAIRSASTAQTHSYIHKKEHNEFLNLDFNETVGSPSTFSLANKLIYFQNPNCEQSYTFDQYKIETSLRCVEM